MKSNNKFWLPVLAARAYIGALALALALTAGFAACDTGTGTSGGDDPGGDGPSDDTNNIVSGVTWTAVKDTAFDGAFIEKIAYGKVNGPGYFVAVGDEGKAAYSSDGETWTGVEDTKFADDEDINGIAYGDGKFVVFGEDPDNKPLVAWCDDPAKEWHAVTETGFGNKVIYGLAYGEVNGAGYFVAVGEGGQAAYFTDPAAEWHAVTVEAFQSPSTNSYYYGINGIAYGDGKFFAVGWYHAAWCSDPKGEWTAVSDTYINNSRLGSIFYGVVGGTGKFVVKDSYGNVAYCADPAGTWALPNTIISVDTIAYGDSKFVAVGSYGKAAYSFDAETWTTVQDTTFDDSIKCITYGAGKFVAVGYAGKMAYWKTP